MAFADFAGPISSGLDFLGGLFGEIGDQGFGKGERLQPEFASLGAALPASMKGIMSPFQAPAFYNAMQWAGNTPASQLLAQRYGVGGPQAQLANRLIDWRNMQGPRSRRMPIRYV